MLSTKSTEKSIQKSSVLANAIRALSMDAVEKAKSGHPGAPMGMADIMEVLWNHFLQHNPGNPHWWNRDRFVLSNGHASMLLYSTLYLSGYDLSMADLQNFRQLHSKTPGHPEFGYCAGVETTTGPLGQGFANAVGMAIAEKSLAAEFNRKDFPIIDHFTYAFVGDGCLMEGISHEVASLAGTFSLGKLIVFFDDNNISIDGEVKNWCKDDVAGRFRSYGWQVIDSIDGHKPESIHGAIQEAQKNTKQPTLIICKTIIGFGAAKKAGTRHAHGAPLGAEEIQAARKQLHWNHPPFVVPEEILEAWNAKDRGEEKEKSWNALFQKYSEKYPEPARELERRLERKLPSDWNSIRARACEAMLAKKDPIATRQASYFVLNELAPKLPELLGGSADLTESNLTKADSAVAVSEEKPNGNYIFYGVREFGMSAMMNGMALYGGFIPYGGTFLMFMEYARNAVRMASLMKQRVIFVYTHDSIGLGEDGPTHQAVEQLASIRLTPGLSLWRPGDALETAYAWLAGIEKLTGPTCLALTRQAVPAIARSQEQIEAIAKGGYILRESKTNTDPDLILIATGSELSLALNAWDTLSKEGKNIRLVSLPSVDVFESQPKEYQEKVLPSQIRKRIVVEASIRDYWYKYAGLDGRIIGMQSFGESAPAPVLFKHFGFTVDNVLAVARELLGA